MDIATLVRKIKRQFGDEHNILINDQDIYDWVNECQLQIIRDTTSNDTSFTTPVNQFPVEIFDRVMVKRVAINNRALTPYTLSEIDSAKYSTTQEGAPSYWYVEDGFVHLWPKAPIADTYNVVITYATTPTPFQLVAPYLQFNYTKPSTQRFTIPASTAFDLTAVNFVVEVTVDEASSSFLAVAKGTSLSTAAQLSYALLYEGASVVGQFRFTYSNGTTIRNAVLQAPVTITDGSKYKLRVTYNPTTALTSIYLIDPVTAVETLWDTDDQADGFNLTTTAGFGITSGSVGGGSYFGGRFKLHGLTLFDPTNPVVVLADFNGPNDLSLLPTVPATPFTTSSYHSATAEGGIQEYYEENSFSVPELYHEDIVRFCIARAHQKNLNFRAAEVSMDEYLQNVSTRRNEADTADVPYYKGVDPLDYDGAYY